MDSQRVSEAKGLKVGLDLLRSFYDEQPVRRSHGILVTEGEASDEPSRQRSEEH